jgi:hypothetical protein
MQINPNWQADREKFPLKNDTFIEKTVGGLTGAAWVL